MKALLWNLYQFFGRLSEKASEWQMSTIRKIDQLDSGYADRRWAKMRDGGFW